MNAKKPTVGTPPGEIDFLAAAIGRMGGVNAASKKLGVKPDTIVRWLERGVGTLPFSRVVEIAKAGGLPVELFRHRLGPFDYDAYSRACGGGKELR
jgi:hypothetical protein